MSSSLPRWRYRDGARPTLLSTGKYVYIAAVVILALTIVALQPSIPADWYVPDMLSTVPSPVSSSGDGDDHVIREMVGRAESRFEALRQSETFSIGNAAKQYRERRGRHPPPGFDDWYALARQSSTVMIEEFFDQIYEDLEPFWGKPPQELRDFILQWPTTLTVRNGTPTLYSSHKTYGSWYDTWLEMARTMPNLPDVDLALLAGDQPMVLAGHQKVSEAMKHARERYDEHRSLSINQIKQKISARPPLTGPIPESWPKAGLVDFPEDSDRFWDYIVTACKPTDPVFTSPELVPNSSLPLVFSEQYTAGTTKGFVSNLTEARSVCHNPNLRTLHGFVIRPGMPNFYTELYPLFAFGKVSGIHNDIVIPAPENYREGIYSGIDLMQPWAKKKNKVLWRGTATGGDWRPDTWFGFQRHRFVSMFNSSLIRQAQADMTVLADQGLPQTYKALRENAEHKDGTFDIYKHHIQLPERSLFSHPLTGLAEWLDKWVDVGFGHFFCFPWRSLGPPGDCPDMEHHFKLAELVPPNEVIMNKYLPDVDGQSISARFRGFLHSTSVPIKATIFTEWHDSRLTPWRDFVPLSNEFQELYEIMLFFLDDGQSRQKKNKNWAGWSGMRKQSSHDTSPDMMAERIGQQGSEWTRRVMRKEDMVLYFHRLILEYARITSDDRVKLGYVDDLLP